MISRNPRSTVGTTTEIYEYLRLLYARIGHTYSPISGCEVRKHSTEDVVKQVLAYSKGTKFVVLAPIHVPEGRTVEQQLKAYLLRASQESSLTMISRGLMIFFLLATASRKKSILLSTV